MAIQDKMEGISTRYVEIIAYRDGHIAWKGHDKGTDLEVRRIIQGRENGDRLDLQIKSVLAKYVQERNESIVYDIEVKNFNDLVRRKKRSKLLPFLLVLFVFPDNENEWLKIGEDITELRKCAYYYDVPDDEDVSGNAASKRISIPKSNHVSLGFFNTLFQLHYDD